MNATSDLPIPAEQLAELLAQHNLPVPERVELVAAGRWRLDDAAVLQLDDAEQTRLGKLATIYGRLQRAGLPVPEVVALDTSRERVAYDYLLTRPVAGVAADSVWQDLDTAHQEALSEALGRLVARVHVLGWPGYGDWTGPGGTFAGHARWSEALFEHTRAISERIWSVAALPSRLIDGAVTAINDGESLIETASAPALIHGAWDWSKVFVVGNGERWEITGLVGWEQAITADVAWEWTTLWLYRDRLYPEFDYFMMGYREVRKPGPDLRARRDLYRLLIHLDGACAAHQEQNDLRRARHEAALFHLLHTG